jgi:hypothetical protein
MGSILFYILKKNKHKSLSAVELDYNMTNFIKEQFPTVHIESKNFLKTSSKNNNYNTIICNPPFTYSSVVKGKRNYDKAFFIMFYFKCLDYMFHTQNRTQNINYLIFIAGPNFFEDIWKKKYFEYLEKKPHGEIHIDTNLDNIRHITKERKERIKQQSDVFDENMTFEEYYEEIQPSAITMSNDLCEFQTTGTKVHFYVMEFHN